MYEGIMAMRERKEVSVVVTPSSHRHDGNFEALPPLVIGVTILQGVDTLMVTGMTTCPTCEPSSFAFLYFILALYALYLLFLACFKVLLHIPIIKHD